MRVLHLIDTDQGRTCPTTLAMAGDLVRGAPFVAQEVLLCGGYRLERAARLAGLDAFERVGVPFGQPALGMPAVSRRIEDLESVGRFDMIHCWSFSALRYADLAQKKTPKVLMLMYPPRKRSEVQRLKRRDPAAFTVLTTNAYAYERLLAGGVSPKVVRFCFPSVDRAWVDESQRAVIREQWPIDPERTRVVALLSDPPAEADAYDAIMAVGLCCEALGADPKRHSDLRVLIHPLQHHRHRAQHLAEKIGSPGRLIQDARIATPWQVMPGCDAALALGPSGGGVSLAWAMAAGLPIVGEACRPISDRAADGETALLVEPGQHKLMAERLQRCVTEKRTPQTLVDRARVRANGVFTPEAFCNRLIEVYHRG